MSFLFTFLVIHDIFYTGNWSVPINIMKGVVKP